MLKQMGCSRQTSDVLWSASSHLYRAVLPGESLLQVVAVLRDAALPGVYEEPVLAGADQVCVGSLESHGTGVTAQHSVHQGRQAAQGGQDGGHVTTL